MSAAVSYSKLSPSLSTWSIIMPAISATRRLKMDLIRLKKDPVPYIIAEPLPTNILEWHYVLTGPEDSPYHGGVYHGRLIFPANFPFKPPSILMDTPNGRFATGTRLCLTISDFHPEKWNPGWSTSSILNGLLSFMLEDKPEHVGGLKTSAHEKRRLARLTHENNLKNETFCELFPEEVKKAKAMIEKQNGNQDNDNNNQEANNVDEVATNETCDCPLQDDNVDSKEERETTEMEACDCPIIDNQGTSEKVVCDCPSDDPDQETEAAAMEDCDCPIIDNNQDPNDVDMEDCNCPSNDTTVLANSEGK